MAAGMVLGRSSTMIGAGAAGFAMGCTSTILLSTGLTPAVVSGVARVPSLVGCSPAGALVTAAVVAGSGSADAMRDGPAGFGASTIFGFGTNRRAWLNSR